MLKYYFCGMERYAVIDVETTGLSPKVERLTEIAIVIFENGHIVDEYSSLINPEKSIPYHITQLTGINNQMVQNAPFFYEIAKKIVELTESCTFVAHNASFDYRFIQAEFARYGYDYQRKIVDTVKLARKMMPGFSSYGLGNLCNQLGIKIENRHRALGDALATVEVLKRILNIESNGQDVTVKGLHTHLDKKVLESLPQKIGVYYFFNDKSELIYIGKSNNIHSRVYSHLNNTATRKAMELREKICSVDYELCGSELVALLMESAEIKKHLPIYNRAQRRTNFQWGIFEDTDAQGYRSLMVYKTSERNDVPLNVFTSKLSAISDLERWTELHGLCQKINGLYQSAGACFHYGIKQCQGACIGEESAESYNLRVDSLLNIFQYENANMLIIEPGRTDDEKSLVLIESNVYRGFGFVSVDELSQSVDVIKSFVKPYTDNKDVAAIIRGFLRHKSPEALITF